MARRENRFVTHWLAPLVLVVVVAGMGIATVAVHNSWWVDPDRPASSDQRAADGSTMLTPAGIDYARATGVLILRVGEDAVPVERLGGRPDGEQLIDADVPLQVRVLAPDGALVLDLMDSVLVTTEQGRITRLEITPWGALSYREFVALLESRAENIGWTSDDLDRLADDLTASQRDGEGDSYSASLADGTAIGAAVSATVTVGRRGSGIGFAITVEP